MDLVDYSEDVFNAIEADYLEFAKNLRVEITTIPVSALKGDNITEHGDNALYTGPCLINYLETVSVDDDERKQPFRMPVQWVNRPSHDFRGFAGQIASGTIHPGDRLKCLPSGKESRIQRIVTYDGDLNEGFAGQSVTITLGHEIDVSWRCARVCR